MKIFKIAIENQIIGPDPSNPANDPNIAQQRIIASQAALNTLKEATTTIEEIGAKIRELEEQLDIPSGTIRTPLETSIQNAISQSDSFIQLQKMNFIRSPRELSDQNIINNITNMINNQMQASPSNR